MTTDTNTGYAKLYHPRGPLVSLPVPSDPKDAFDHIARCLDAGWLVIAPGLEEGEQKEEVGYVLRGQCDGNGETTPFLLLYSTNEGHAFSFLKVYLNKPADVDAFEYAAGMKLAQLPEYMGNDKPERGKSPKLDRFIVRMARPFNVVMKANPKYSESERAEVMKRNDIYKVPRRLFVRWADQAKVAPTPSAPEPTPTYAPRKTTPAAPVSKPAQQTPAQQPVTPEKGHATLLAAFAAVKTQEKLDEWAKWGKDNFDFTQAQEDEQSDAYHAALERIALASAPTNRRHAMANDGIPF